MKTITYEAHIWYDEIWPRIVKDHSAFHMGEELGFVLRNEFETIGFDDSPAGYEQEFYHLDFERDEDYTLFILKFHNVRS
jgi:hypothetical protein